MQASMLFLAVIGLTIPTILAATVLEPINNTNQMKIQFLSDALALLLLIVYIASIAFTFFTHKHLFIFKPREDELVINRERNGNKRDEKEQSSSQHPEIMTQWSKKRIIPFAWIEYGWCDSNKRNSCGINRSCY